MDLRPILAIPFLLGAAAPRIEVDNRAAVPQARVERLLREYRDWGERVYAYLQPSDPGRVVLVLSPDAGPGFYSDGRILMRPDEDAREMLETWVHELAHHATGHDSSFLLKEGIATHTLEHLLGKDDLPQGWPNYGAASDDWVRLFVARGQMPGLAAAAARPHYDGSSRESDYRSWQVYLVGSSFVGWLIREKGLDAFKRAFAAGMPLGDIGKLEREWLASLKRGAPLPDAKALLPDTSRYRYFAGQLQP